MLKWRGIFPEGYTSPLLPITSSPLLYLLKLYNMEVIYITVIAIIFNERGEALKNLKKSCMVVARSEVAELAVHLLN